MGEWMDGYQVQTDEREDGWMSSSDEWMGEGWVSPLDE